MRDQIGVVKRFIVIERYRDKTKMIYVAYVGVAANPGKLQFTITQKINNFAIAATMYKDDRSRKLLLQIITPFIQKSGLIIENYRGQSNAYRRKVESMIRGRCMGCAK